MKKYFRQKLINFLAKQLFKTIVEDDFLTISKMGVVKFKGKILDNAQKADLIRNARDLLDNQAWQLMLIEMSFVANKKIYFDSGTMEDMVGGKLILWTLDVMFKKVIKLAELK